MNNLNCSIIIKFYNTVKYLNIRSTYLDFDKLTLAMTQFYTNVKSWITYVMYNINI